MNALLPLFLGLQGIVFLLWIVVAFRWLFALRADAVAWSGNSMPGLPTQLAAFRAGLVDARYRGHRRRLLVLTALLLVLAMLSVFIVQ